jgi:hypothetical protein
VNREALPAGRMQPRGESQLRSFARECAPTLLFSLAIRGEPYIRFAFRVALLRCIQPDYLHCYLKTPPMPVVEILRGVGLMGRQSIDREADYLVLCMPVSLGVDQNYLWVLAGNCVIYSNSSNRHVNLLDVEPIVDLVPSASLDA